MKTKAIRTGRFLLSLTALLFVWRGIIGLMDTFIFPEEPTFSYFFSIIIGVIMFIIILLIYDDDFKL